MLNTYTVPLHLKEKVKQIGYREIDQVRQLRFWKVLCIIGWLLFFLMIGLYFFPDLEAREINVDKLTNAIYKAENSKTHPYGILTHYKHTTPRQACINTINHALKDWNGKGNFIVFLGSRYCPIGAKNDPKGLNKNWVRLVKYFLKNG